MFAADEIEQGRVIHVLGGEKIPLRVAWRRVRSGSVNLNDPLQIGPRTYLELDPVSRTFNHGCNPTAGLRRQSELFALRDIKAGAEITYDYSLTVAPAIVWSMSCRCGSRRCRKTIGSIATVPREQLNEYVRQGALQDFMQRLLKLR